MFDFVVSVVEKSGYAGIFGLMLAENVFPPFPSEVIMPLAGYAAASGDLHIAGVIAAGTLGSLAGAAMWYAIARRIGLARLRRWTGRHGRFLAFSPEELQRATAWFGRHCTQAVLFGRLIPTLRTLVSLPAGIAGMRFGRFLVYTALGSALWTAALAGLGFVLEDQYQRIGHVLNPVSNVIAALIVAAYVYRVATYKSRPAE